MKSKEIKEWFVNNEKLYFTSIELTQNCNFKCKHCYCSDKESKNLSLQDWMNIIDKLHSTGCLFLNFTGGEIFTYKYFKEVYIYAKNKGFIIDLLTNVSILDHELIELFKKLPPNNIAITIYGTNEEEYFKFTGSRGNFDKVIKALELLQLNNIHFVLRTVATKTLKNSLLNGNFQKLAERFNTTFKYDPIVFPKTTGENDPLKECMNVHEIIDIEINTPERKEAWERKIKNNSKFNWSCKGGISSMAIDFRGNAFICGLYRRKPISILNYDINIVLEHLRKIHKEHVRIVESNYCSICDKRSICKWCPAYSFIYTNNDNKRIGFFCDLAKGRVEAFGEKK